MTGPGAARRLRVVVDANKAAAALIRPDGFVAAALAREDVEFLAPAFLLAELTDHLDEYAERAACPSAELRRRIDVLASRLSFVPAPAMVRAARDPRVVAVTKVDPDDAPYVAALVAAQADLLWTSDAAIRKAFPTWAVAVLPRL